MSEIWRPRTVIPAMILGAIAFQGCMNYTENRLEEIGREFQEVEWERFFEVEEEAPATETSEVSGNPHE